jgi:hypothetical protein
MSKFFKEDSSPNATKKILYNLNTKKLGKDIFQRLTSNQLSLSYVGLKTLAAQGESYLPASNQVSPGEYSALLKYLKTAEASGHEGGNIKVTAVGIPANLIQTLRNPPYTMGQKDLKSTEGRESDSIIVVKVHKKDDLEHPELVFKPLTFLFDMSIFILPGGIVSEEGSGSFHDILEDNKSVKFNRVTAFNIGQSDKPKKSGKQLITDFFLNDKQRKSIARNHTVDYLLKVYYKLLLGVIIDEHTFPVDSELNDLMVDLVGKSAIMIMQGNEDVAPYVTAGSIPAEDMMNDKEVQESAVAKVATTDDLSDQLVPSVVDAGNCVCGDCVCGDTPGSEPDAPANVQPVEEVIPPETTEEEVKTFQAVCESTLVSSPMMKMRALSPNIFDRVFLIPVDPDHFEIDVDESVKNMGGKEAFNKEMTELTETVTTPDGQEILRLKPRPASEGYSTMQSIFTSISSVTVEAD